MKTKAEYNAYMKSYMNARWKKRRAKAEARLGGKCNLCGSTEELEFDHIDPSTKATTIGRASSMNDEKFWKEVDKCQLLCGVHHRLKTSSEQSVGHGGGVSGKRNCKCQPCKQMKAKYTAKRRLEKKKIFTGGLMVGRSAVNGDCASSTLAP